jgi:hypothetical protein
MDLFEVVVMTPFGVVESRYAGPWDGIELWVLDNCDFTGGRYLKISKL